MEYTLKCIKLYFGHKIIVLTQNPDLNRFWSWKSVIAGIVFRVKCQSMENKLQRFSHYVV